MNFSQTDVSSGVAILILAAGSSSRMRGTDKLAETVAGQPLVRRVASRAVETGADVFVALPPARPDRLTLIDGLPVTPVIVEKAVLGMSESILAGLAALPDGAPFMILLADLPDITTDDLRLVMSARHTSPNAKIWRGATPDGKPGHPILCDAALRGEFLCLTGDTGGDVVLKAHVTDTYLVRFADNRARLDLDTPEDWSAWRRQN